MTPRLWLSLSILVFGTLACDQWAKQAAVGDLRAAPSRSYFGGVVELTYAENRGAFLGLGDRLDPNTRFWLLTIGGFGLLAVLSMTLLARGVRSRSEIVGWGLLLGGGLGNLIDRVMRDGSVVDFLRLSYGPLSTAIFNLADVFILAGVVALVIIPRTERPSIEEDDPAKAQPISDPEREYEDGVETPSDDSSRGGA